jgi:hypothetical protein
MNPVQEHLRATFGGFRNLQDDPQKQRLHDAFDQKNRREAAKGVATAIEMKIQTLGELIKSMPASDERRALGGKMLRMESLAEAVREEAKHPGQARSTAPAAEEITPIADVLEEEPNLSEELEGEANLAEELEGPETRQEPSKKWYQFWKK